MSRTNSHDLYQLAASFAAPAAFGRFALKLRNRPTVLFLERPAINAAMTCRAGADLRGHRQRMEAVLGSRERAVALLDKLLGSGFLVTATEMQQTLNDCAAPPDSKKPEQVEVGMPTKNRPTTFCRALRTYVGNTQRSHRSPAFKVIDYSQPDAAGVNLKNCRCLVQSCGARLAYADLSRVKGFATRLSGVAGVAESVIRFGLGMSASARSNRLMPSLNTYGGVRNALLLETAGVMSISVDDDTECVMAEPTPQRSGLELASTSCPFRFSLGLASISTVLP